MNVNSKLDMLILLICVVFSVIGGGTQAKLQVVIKFACESILENITTFIAKFSIINAAECISEIGLA